MMLNKFKNLSMFQIVLGGLLFECVLMFVFLVGISPDPKNAWLWGFSRTRIIIFLGVLGGILILTWLNIQVWRKTSRSQKWKSILLLLLGKEKIVWGMITGLIALTAIGGWLLAHWLFAGKDQQISAYLQRLTPLVVFGVVVCIQFIVLISLNFVRKGRIGYLFGLSVLGGCLLFLWLFVVEFYLVDYLFPEIQIKFRFQELIQTWMPFILFQTGLTLQLPFFLKHQIELKLDARWFYVLILVVLGYFYYSAAVLHARENNADIKRSDQGVYVEFTQKVSGSGFKYTGQRNQTPGLGSIMAIFCNAKESEQALFSCGKRANIQLSLVMLVCIFLVSYKYLSFSLAYILTLITAVSVFIFKSGYFTAELTYYFLSFVGYILMCRMLIKPSLILGLITGIVLGLAFMFKASVLAGAAIFVLVYIMIGILFVVRRGKKSVMRFPGSKSIGTHFAGLILVGLGFLGVTFQYLGESKAIYGHYFYNVNSTFYIWYDDFDEAKQGEMTYGFMKGWPDQPPEQLPSLQNYLRDHSWPQVIERFLGGLGRQLEHIRNPYGVFNYILLYSLFLVIAVIFKWDRVPPLFKPFWGLLLFNFLYFGVHIILFGWYFAIAGGPRFILGLFLPYMFASSTALQTLVERPDLDHLERGHRSSRGVETVLAIIIALAISDAYVVITEILPKGYFGS